MKRLLTYIENANRKVLGINDRNLSYIYPHNPRKFFTLADDKSVSKQIFEKNGIPVPETYAIIESFREIDIKIKELVDLPTMVIKPAMGSMGQGILILRKQGGELWITPAGEKFNLERLKLHLASVLNGAFSAGNTDKVLVEYCLIPDPVLREIFSDGIPDIRILIFKDNPLLAMLRMPTKRSRGKANLHQGAIGIGIDLNSGKLLNGFYRNRYIHKHPDTGVHFTGTQLPRWDQTLEIAYKAARFVPLKYLGIDIILDEEKGPQVVEINARPGLQIQNANLAGLNEIINKKMK